METVYVMHGTSLKREDNTIRVTLETGKKVRLPVENVKHLVIPTACQMNTELLNFLGKSRVRVSFLDYYGNHQASLEPALSYGSGAVHLAQASQILDSRKRLTLAKTLMDGAAYNLIQNLKYYQYRGRPLEKAVQIMQFHRDRLSHAETIEQLMGSEGLLRQSYYSAWEIIHPSLTIARRTRRPPTDRINSLISFGNGLMYSACQQAITQTHLDPALSFVHAPTQARSSLALDLAEIFKPVVIDRLIFRWVNRGIIADALFQEEDGVCLLSRSGRDEFVEDFRREMDSTPVNTLVGYHAVILREAYRLEAHVLEMEEYQPFLRRV